MTKRYYITRKHLVRYRAMLVLKLDRELNWSEFFDLVGIPVNTGKSIQDGKRHGSLKTAQTIVESMRDHGVAVHLSDLEL